MMNGGTPPFKVAHNHIVGRHFLATRDLQAGDVILHNSPLVTGPPLLTDRLVCVSCYNPIQDENCSFSCCGWSVCSPKCANSKVHSPECHLTRTNFDGGKIDIRKLLKEYPIYHSLIILRCLLLKKSNPIAWEKLLKLESHCAKRQATGHYEKDRETIAKFLLSHFCLDKEFSEQDVLKICGVVQVNNYLVRLNEPFYLAVYDVASFIEHDCVPNCAKVFTDNGDIIIKAVRVISKEDHLSICYTDATCGTRPRRKKLLDELLACRCRRCCDSTELQSFFSALQCKNQGCPGYILPEQPILEDINNNSSSQDDTWLCSSCSCKLPGDEVVRLLESVSRALTQLDKTDFEECEKFLANQNAVLHLNHYLLLPVRLALAGRTISSVPDKELTKVNSELGQLLRLTDLILPGENRIRGMLLYQMASAALEMLTRKVRCDDISINEYKSSRQKPKELLEKSLEVLRDQPDTVPEGKFRRLAEESLLSFDSVL